MVLSLMTTTVTHKTSNFDTSVSQQFGKLILGATPIGNSGDASSRLIEALQVTELILAEDTRVTLNLAKRLKVRLLGQLLSLNDYNEFSRIDQVIATLEAGNDVLLVSDAGMPLVNDPGFKVVRQCIELGVTVTCLPGPSAPITALVLCGLPVNRFCFEGFIPPKSGQRLNFLTDLVDERRTQIYLESPHRIHKTLETMRQVFGPTRRIAVVREMTKSYEEVIRGTIEEVISRTTNRQLKGEICICVEGSNSAVKK
jgi:16S rRNA (cytidine1402-2'-O)-methyltransferase